MGVVEGGSKMNLVASYAAGEDANIGFGSNTWLAQTFTLAAPTTILWRHRMKYGVVLGGGQTYHLRLRAVDGAGKPAGGDIAATTKSPTGEDFYSPYKWMRSDWDTFPEVPAGTYALILSVDSVNDWDHEARADITEPDFEGKAWRSPDGGASWDELEGTAFMFEIWGYEPPPPPPPAPTIGNWALLTCQVDFTPTGCKVVTTTNIATHLFMRWTKIEAQRHIKLTKYRGGMVEKLLDQCFVAYEDNEQEEAGDTLTHTFIKEPWATCETRMFYFFGYKQTEVQPSITAIFKYHRGELPVPEFELVIEEIWSGAPTPPEFELVIDEPWTGETFVMEFSPHYPDHRDGYVYRDISAGEWWSDMFLGVGTGNVDSQTVVIWGVIFSHSTPSKWRRIRRGLVAFDTSTLPDNAVIMNASLKIHGQSKLNTLGANPALGVYCAYGVNPANFVNDDYQAVGITLVSNKIAYDDFNAPGWNYFWLKGAGIAHIEKAGSTVFGFREANYDGTGAEPPWVATSGITFQGYGHRNGDAYKEVLRITYVIP